MMRRDVAFAMPASRTSLGRRSDTGQAKQLAYIQHIGVVAYYRVG